MSTSDDNLLSFLKKQSLFNNSPSKNLNKRRSSRSRDKHSDSRNSPINAVSYNYEPQFANTQNYGSAERNYNFELQKKNNYTPIQNESMNFQAKLSDSRYKTLEALEDKRDYRNPEVGMRVDYEPAKVNYETSRVNQPNMANMWTGLVSYTTSFQSARIQSEQCLENLSNKIHNQIASINYKLENFNSKMRKVINGEFKNLKQRIYMIVEESFKESEKYIRQYMKIQEDTLAKDMVIMREHLQKELVNIDSMKEEIKKPHWRKVAGEIIASELENKVEQITKKSASLEVGRWELGNVVGYRLKDLEKDIRDIVRLRKQT